MSKIKAISLVWLPTASEPDKKLQGAGECSALKLAANAGAAHVSIYDATTLAACTPNSRRWVLDASTTDVDAQCFTEPLTFSKGVYAVCEQGVGLGAEVCLAMSKYIS